MKRTSELVAWSTGIAIFSMFFGSGNVVFPILLGQTVGDEIVWALLGLMITSVGAPLLGLLGAVLYEGDCKKFFYRIGEIPGYCVVLLILALLGPLGVMPRCFIVTYGAIQGYFPQLSLLTFSILIGILTLGLIARRQYVLPILGYVLSPMLILTLLIIIGTSIFMMKGIPNSPYTPMQAFSKGLMVGYDTMDLLAAIFFAVSIWLLLKEKLSLDEQEVKQNLIPIYLIASLIGGGLLMLIYIGLTFSAAVHADALVHAKPERVLAVLAIRLLGDKLGFIANMGIALACITTVMSLAVAVVDVIHVEIANTRIGKKLKWSYGLMMIIVMVITVVFTNLGFNTIMRYLHPMMVVCYPAIIVLTICNILYKTHGFKYV
jgi:LIVCS family branched-chain amino acid:cation transporter